MLQGQVESYKQVRQIGQQDIKPSVDIMNLTSACFEFQSFGK